MVHCSPKKFVQIGNANRYVWRTNTIAHGSKTDGVTETEYKKWENIVKDIMESIVKKIYFYANNEKYLRVSNE